ncbi:MAG: DUF397 domain-containing protein [Gemmataceae bacterium]
MEDLSWFTSSFSSANGQCVECARTPDGGMAVRDTKDREGAMLRFGAAQWRAFTERVGTAISR